MTRSGLIGVIVAAVLVVAALAAITPTVLVDNDHHERGARVDVTHGRFAPWPGNGRGFDPRFRGGYRGAPAPGR